MINTFECGACIIASSSKVLTIWLLERNLLRKVLALSISILIMHILKIKWWLYPSVLWKTGNKKNPTKPHQNQTNIIIYGAFRNRNMWCPNQHYKRTEKSEVLCSPQVTHFWPRKVGSYCLFANTVISIQCVHTFGKESASFLHSRTYYKGTEHVWLHPFLRKRMSK